MKKKEMFGQRKPELPVVISSAITQHIGVVSMFVFFVI